MLFFIENSQIYEVNGASKMSKEEENLTDQEIQGRVNALHVCGSDKKGERRRRKKQGREREGMKQIRIRHS